YERLDSVRFFGCGFIFFAALFLLRSRRGRSGGGAFSRGLIRLADDWRNSLKTILLVQVDQFDPLRVTAGFTNVFDGDSDHLSADGDEHDLVLILDGQGADDSARAVIGFHGDDALAPA